LTGREHVRNGHNPTNPWARMLIGMALASMTTLLPAQVSLTTVVDLAQRNSSTVKLAGADVMRAQAELSKTKDVFLPNAMLGSGLPAFPSVGFTGGVPSILNGTVQSLVFDLPQKQYIDAARSGLKAAELNLKNAREQVALDASTAYLELDTVDSELDASGQQLAFADRLVKIEQERTEAGVDPLSEWLHARLTAAQFRLNHMHLQTRASTLAKQLSVLTGLPTGSITPDHSSIPEIPQVRADEPPLSTAGIESAQMFARSKQKVARGDSLSGLFPQIVFNAEYIRSTRLLNNADDYYVRNLPPNNFSSGFSIQLPVFDIGHYAKARESAAGALRATVEAEQAQRQNEVQIAELTGSLRELDALAEIASLKQQIANQQLQSVMTQLELGNGAGNGPGAPAQLTPKAEQLARIDERQKLLESMDAGFDLAKARLSLLCALGHMEDWLHELHAK
jgi:outer membrane protein TolC